MTDHDDCITQAMFAASESYSGSTYQNDLLGTCINTATYSDSFIPSPRGDAMNLLAA